MSAAAANQRAQLAPVSSRIAARLDARKGGYRQGRGKEAWPPIPSVRNYQVDAIADWMQSHRENRRPLSVAAPLLTIVCALADKQYQLPTRVRLAEEIHCTKDGIDAAISTALAYGEITERYEVIEGAVQQRRSSRRVRFLDPSADLLRVYRAAVRDYARE